MGEDGTCVLSLSLAPSSLSASSRLPFSFLSLFSLLCSWRYCLPATVRCSND
ncbi:hypothetical protein BDV26DRAFT_251070 [Aspergillus bertholletiae]|uniref:Uncharacterized protein n=1 Tax=Aspergillus bertholletiae TaxID=1226010 RepID=A0A5N7BNW9_9EURO|nr:hypothetical protein BDV26DRAFT_251070 [Aspergillus bertholletiae]